MKKLIFLVGSLFLISCTAAEALATGVIAASTLGEVFNPTGNSDSNTNINSQEGVKNKSFALSRVGQTHVYYIDIPSTDDYEIRSGRIEFEVKEYGPFLVIDSKIKGVFINKSPYQYTMKIELNGYLADGTLYKSVAGQLSFTAEERANINATITSGASDFPLEGNKIIFPIDDSYGDGIVISLYKRDKLVYRTNLKETKKTNTTNTNTKKNK